MQCNHF